MTISHMQAKFYIILNGQANLLLNHCHLSHSAIIGTTSRFLPYLRRGQSAACLEYLSVFPMAAHCARSGLQPRIVGMERGGGDGCSLRGMSFSECDLHPAAGAGTSFQVAGHMI